MNRKINYSPKKCEKCGNMFTPRNSRHSWCDDCLTKTCLQCGKAFKIEKKTKYESSKFCSRECMGLHNSIHNIGGNATAYKNGNRTKIKTICSNCGKEILKEKQHVDKWNNVFCNRQCQAEYYRRHSIEVSGENSPKYSQQEVSCEQCGKIFKVYNCNKDIARFCSKKCRNDWQSEMMLGSKHYNWDGGKTNWKSSIMAKREYKKWREAVLSRDNHTCQECGAKDVKLNAHHIKPVKDYPDLIYDLDNGKTLCFQCHMKEHSKIKT